MLLLPDQNALTAGGASRLCSAMPHRSACIILYKGPWQVCDLLYTGPWQVCCCYATARCGLRRTCCVAHDQRRLQVVTRLRIVWICFVAFAVCCGHALALARQVVLICCAELAAAVSAQPATHCSCCSLAAYDLLVCFVRRLSTALLQRALATRDEQQSGGYVWPEVQSAPSGRICHS
jgi:hypothetical protein